MISNRKRMAFTRIELLIVVGAISALIAMLLPAVQQVREDAKRTLCAIRIRQLALGGQNYHDAHRRLPPGALCAQGAVDYQTWVDPSHNNYRWNQQFTSATMMIAPFMELSHFPPPYDPIMFDTKNNLSQHLVDGEIVYERFIEIQGYWDIATLDFHLVTCPADATGQAESFLICAIQPTHNGNPSSVDQDHFSMLSYREPKHLRSGRTHFMGRTNYLACTGANTGGKNRNTPNQSYVGCMGPREVRTLDGISDGTANTVMFAEALGEIQFNPSTQSYERIYTHSWVTGGIARGRGSAPLMTQPKNITDMLGSLKNSSWTGFGSAHPDGVNAACVDGSVTLISREIDWQVWYALCGEQDGSTLASEYLATKSE